MDMSSKVLHVFFSGLLCSLLTGCADLPAPPVESVREDWGKIAVVPAGYPPQSNIRSFAVGKGEGAAKGAVIGAAAGFGAVWVSAAAAGPIALVLAPYLAVITATAEGAAGAYGGSQSAITEQDVAAMEQHVQQNLALLKIPGTLSQAIVETTSLDTGRQLPLLHETGLASAELAPDYRSLAQQDANSVLEVVVTDVGFTGGRQLRFYMEAAIRVVRVSDSVSLYQREFIYQSDAYTASRWGENKAALFQAELQRAYTSIAESVVEQVFLLTALPLESRARASSEDGLNDLLGGLDACGLAWVSPQHDYHPNIGEHREFNRFTKLDSRQPTLAWEAFPRDTDRHSDARATLSGISNVRYDLRLWQVVADTPPRLIYERRSLTEPSHTMEQALEPASRYFWSARARFDLAGRVHGTKWGYFRSPNYMVSGGDRIKPGASPAAVVGPFLAGAAPRDVCTLDFIPVSNYYRFKTP